MKLIDMIIKEDGIVFETSEGMMDISFCTPSIARIRYTVEPSFSEKASLMIVNRSKGKMDWSATDREAYVEISTGDSG